MCTSDSGSFFSTDGQFLRRALDDRFYPDDIEFLRSEGHLVREHDPLGKVAYLRALAERFDVGDELDYLILVPTLRCNLSCSYCQVSRAALEAKGYDWTEETLASVIKLLDAHPGPSIKIEFQGGEPTLRPDLIRAVIERAERFERRQFVICTNLQTITPETLALFDHPDLYLSTSLDGDLQTHRANRTEEAEPTSQFFENLRFIIERYGPGKVSALPTIDPGNPPDIGALIDAYQAHGFNSIFLRPINYQGFARKQHSHSREQGDTWRAYYERFVRELIARNWQNRSSVFEETYFSICLRRIFQPGADRHVDLRNPNAMGSDYIVVDYDGQVYPTDEARMLSRSGVIDLAIGTIGNGWQTEKRAALNAHSSNLGDPACERCTYQPFCGRDLVDDISRYGRIDLPRHETEFCRKHLHTFDFIFRLIYEDDPAVTYSLSRWLRLDGTPQSLGMRHA